MYSRAMLRSSRCLWWSTAASAGTKSRFERVFTSMKGIAIPSDQVYFPFAFGGTEVTRDDDIAERVHVKIRVFFTARAGGKMRGACPTPAKKYCSAVESADQRLSDAAV